MEKTQNMYLGVDVSKGYADFCLLDQQKLAAEKPFQLDDNRQGHEMLRVYLEDYIHQGKRIICGVESTGGYEQNWLVLLKAMSKDTAVEVYKLNPRGVKHHIESTLRRTITDRVSAQGIAEYLVNHYEQYQSKWSKSISLDVQMVAAQRCCRLITGLIKQQTARYNQLEKLLYQIFPELLIFCKNGTPNWVIRLLIKYPGLSAIKRANPEALAGIKGISAKKAQHIKTMANQSVAKPTTGLEEVVIKTLTEDINHHQPRIEELKSKLISCYKSPGIDLVKSIRGISDWTATAIIMLLADCHRFENTHQLAAFYGVHPRFKQSGDGKWTSRMSKQGNSMMRSILYIAACNVIIHEPYFKKLYHHYMSRGKKATSVRGIIMHKLLRVIYGMLKNQQPFNSTVDEKNRSSNMDTPQEMMVPKVARRYQELTMNAPISRSNYKKRRAALEIQISSDDIITDSSKAADSQI